MADLAAVPVPEPVTVTRYRCPFCHRSRSSKKATAEHIARCWLNPAVRSCKTCVNYDFWPAGDYCMGTPCNCNDAAVYCEAGIDIADFSIRTACPLWALREEAA
jgi:hypothetical protein